MIISMKMKFSRTKGFTLVECIIAVAVFGLLSLVVFMILTNASVRASRASESEENLAQLIENVVGDETYKKYDATSRSMTLLINNSSDTMTISYNVISGYKNFVECPNTDPGTGVVCGHQANFVEFMSDSATSMVAHPDPATFQVGTNYFVCPKCEQQVVFQLKCDDCGTTDAYNKTSSTSPTGYLFTYMATGTGGFECSVCGSTAVMAVDAAGDYISEKVSVDGFNVSGLVANGIRYGEPIDWNYWDDTSTTNHRTELCKFKEASAVDPTLPSTPHNTNGGILAGLSYSGTSNSAYVGTGTYTLSLSVSSLPAEISATSPYFIELVFPSGYMINVLDSHPEVTLSSTTIDAKKYPTMLISKTGMGSLLNNIRFTLTSTESGYPFEYDYNRASGDGNAKQGLFRWFGFTSFSNETRRADDSLTGLSASGLQIAN